MVDQGHTDLWAPREPTTRSKELECGAGKVSVPTELVAAHLALG
jgi:hypothetical protein